MKVFISHSHTDAPLAAKVAEALEESGLEVWNADRDLLPGDNWAAKVAEALEESEAMVVLLTQDAIRSPYVKRDMQYALGARNYRHRLFPVAVDGPAPLPGQEIPWFLRQMPWFELDSRHAEVKPIADAIRSHS